MRKFSYMIITISLLFTLTGCGKDKYLSKIDDKNEQQEQQPLTEDDTSGIIGQDEPHYESRIDMGKRDEDGNIIEYDDGKGGTIPADVDLSTLTEDELRALDEQGFNWGNADITYEPASFDEIEAEIGEFVDSATPPKPILDNIEKPETPAVTYKTRQDILNLLGVASMAELTEWDIDSVVIGDDVPEEERKQIRSLLDEMKKEIKARDN